MHDIRVTSPLTVCPQQIIGYVNGRPVRAIAGGAPDGDENGGQNEGQSGGQNSGSNGSEGSDSGTSSTSGSGQQSGQSSTAEKVEDLPEWAQKQIRDARAEAGNHRTAKNAAEQKQAEMLDAIAKGLGLKQDEKPDPAKLASELTAAQAAQREAQVELAVFRTAAKHQGDPTALLDSRSFLAKVQGLDPTASDFAAKVDAAIKDAVKDNPKLRTGQAPGTSGVDHSGGAGERRTGEPKSLFDAVANSYGT